MNHAVKRGLMKRNVCLAVESPNSDEQEMEPLTAEQAQRFLRASEGDRLHALYVLALTLGARQGELFGLHWDDVDFAGRSIYIRRTLNESNGVRPADEIRFKRS